MFILSLILGYAIYCLIQVFLYKEHFKYLTETYDRLKNVEQKDVKKLETQVWIDREAIIIFSNYVVKLDTKSSGFYCYTFNFYDILSYYWYNKFKKLIISKPFLDPNVKE